MDIKKLFREDVEQDKLSKLEVTEVTYRKNKRNYSESN